MNITIDERGVVVNNIEIKEVLFQQEMSDYGVVDREDQIDHLIDWISESDSDSDKYLMKEDLKYLISLKDKFVFSSVSTNEYIAESVDKERFDEICKEILSINEDVVEE